jgi:hypothetical protein
MMPQGIGLCYKQGICYNLNFEQLQSLATDVGMRWQCLLADTRLVMLISHAPE